MVEKLVKLTSEMLEHLKISLIVKCHILAGYLQQIYPPFRIYMGW